MGKKEGSQNHPYFGYSCILATDTIALEQTICIVWECLEVSSSTCFCADGWKAFYGLSTGLLALVFAVDFLLEL